MIEKIIAHRGESFTAPENSLSAINMAWKNGARAVEIDIHLTADNEIVVIHDRHTGRVGDRKLIVKKTNFQKLSKVDIGRKKAKSYTGERIPSLNDVVETLPWGAKLVIEIKCGKKIIAPLIQLLQNSKLKNHQIEIISFHLDVLAVMSKEAPQYKYLWLLDLDYYLPHWMLYIRPKKIIKKLKENGLDGVNVWAGKIIDKSFVKAFQDEGFHFYVWTVNELDEAERVLSYGIDAITTDRAEWIRKQLAGIKQ